MPILNKNQTVEKSRFMYGLSPQSRATSGRWRRNPMIRSMYVKPSTISPVSVPSIATPTDIDLNADFGEPSSISNDPYGQMIGNQVAQSMGNIGLLSAVPTVMAHSALGVQPTAATMIGPALATMFGPLALATIANSMIGQAISANQAAEQGESVENITQNPVIAQAVEEATMASLPTTALGHLMDLIGIGNAPADLAGQIGLGMAGTTQSQQGEEDPFASQVAISSALGIPGGFPSDIVSDTAPSQSEQAQISEQMGLTPIAPGGISTETSDQIGGVSTPSPGQTFGEEGAEGEGESPGLCIIVSVCTHPHSYEANITRMFRDLYLDDQTLGGYYAIAHVIVPIIERYSIIKKITKKFLVDRLVDYGEAAMCFKFCVDYRTSNFVTKWFLRLCRFVGNYTNCSKLIAQHR